MPLKPPQSHWAGVESPEWDTARSDASATSTPPEVRHDYPQITRREQIAVFAAVLAMLLAAWWLR